ncbi:MAG: homoserine kinase [bacterium]
MKSVRVRVPATTANLGPGFDAMGIALRVYNTTTVSQGVGQDPGGMAAEAADLFFEASGVKAFDFHWSVEGDVPMSRGLGSSVTVRLGVLHGLNKLAGSPLDRQRVFKLCAELEGHPDNAAPAAFGGFCIAPKRGPLQRYPVSEELAFVLLIPEMELETSKARGVLPAKIPLPDAALSVGNAAAVAGAFASGDYRKLAGCFDDRLHQPYRAKLMPFLGHVIAAGCDAGALGGWLSGAGSTIACASLRRPDKVANAMISACGLESACAVVVRADNSGVKIA